MSNEDIMNNTIQTISMYTISLPDREVQYSKTPAYVDVETISYGQPQVIDTYTETPNEKTPVIINGSTMYPTQITIQGQEYTTTDKVMLTEGEGRDTKVIMLSECATKVSDSVALLDSKTGGKGGLVGELTVKEQGNLDISDKIIATYAKGDYVDAETLDEQLKHKGEWGLGCPNNCGRFYQFTYDTMIPQSFICDTCGKLIILE
jgi:hypothetical protein